MSVRYAGHFSAPSGMPLPLESSASVLRRFASPGGFGEIVWLISMLPLRRSKFATSSVRHVLLNRPRTVSPLSVPIFVPAGRSSPAATPHSSGVKVTIPPKLYFARSSSAVRKIQSGPMPMPRILVMSADTPGAVEATSKLPQGSKLCVGPMTLPVAPSDGELHSSIAANRKAAADATTRAVGRLSMS